MNATTVQPPIGGWFPDQPAEDLPTDRYPQVQRVIDEFFPKGAAVDEAIDQATARQIVADVAILVPVPEQDTDTGWARLAGVLGINPHAAVA